MPLFFLLTILLVVLIKYTTRRSTKEDELTSREFWRREQEANFTRAADISQLPYIRIPSALPDTLHAALTSVPVDTPDAEELHQLTRSLLDLTEAPILNLTGQTNTDLKLQYGRAHLEQLTLCEENFTQLCRILNRSAHILHTYNMDAQAVQLLEFAVSCRSDVQDSYLLLGRLYQASQNWHRLAELTESISHFDDLRRASLEDALRSCHTER